MRVLHLCLLRRAALPHDSIGWAMRKLVKALPVTLTMIALPASLMILGFAALQRPISKPPVTLSSKTIQIMAPTVEVDVVVQDRWGHYVSGLQASDFKVYENNILQKINDFVPPPVSARSKAKFGSQPPGVTRGSSGTGVQFITLVLDLADMSHADTHFALQATIEYLQKAIRPADYISVYWIGGSLHLAVPFTRDKAEAVSFLNRLAREVATGFQTKDERSQTHQQIRNLLARAASSSLSAASALSQEAEILQADLWTGDNFQARALFMALRTIAQQYRTLPGRKSVILLSDGVLSSPEIHNELSAVIDAANRSIVSFYVIDGTGLKTATTLDEATSPNPAPRASSNSLHIAVEGIDEFGTAYRQQPYARLNDLSSLAYETGGLLIKNQNVFLSTLKEVDQDLRDYYTLVYQPVDTVYDGAFRGIRVELDEHGYRLRYRQGYWAIPSGEEAMLTPTAEQLLTSAASGSLKPSFQPVLNADLLVDSEGKPSVPIAIQFPPRSVRFQKQGSQYTAGITLVIAVRNSSGNLVGVHQRFTTLKMNAVKLKNFKKSAVYLYTHISVPRLEPLKVQTIVQFSNHRFAVSECGIQPSDPSGGPELTSLLLTNIIFRAPGLMDPRDPLRVSTYELFLPPREIFSRGSQTTFLIGVLDYPTHSTTLAAPITLAVNILSGKKVVKRIPAGSLRPVNMGDSGRAQIVRQVSLAGLPAGPYTAEVTATDSVHHSSNTQEAPFEIE